MRTHRTVAGFVLILGLAAAASRADAPGASAAPLRAIEDAVFDTWLPVDSLGLDAPSRSAAFALRDSLAARFAQAPEMVAALQRLAGLVPGFTRMAPGAREARFLALIRKGNDEQRRLAMQLRLAYLTAIYGSPFGQKVADVAGATPPPRPPALQFVAGYYRPGPPLRFRFAPTWLRVDAPRRALAPDVGEIDEVIVGSGPSGSVLAHELAMAGHRVVLLEQGSFVSPGTMNTRSLPQLLESGGRRSSVSGSVRFNNAETVGGGSTVNIDLVFPPTRASVKHQIDHWRASGGIDPDQYLPADLERTESWVEARLGTRTPDTTEINRNNHALWDGARREGLHPSLYKLNTWPPDYWPTPQTDKRSAVEMLWEAMTIADRTPLALIPDAQVLRVDITHENGGDRAHGVTFVVRRPWNSDCVIADPLKLKLAPGDTLHVEAPRVILCAGTLGSATILMRSGLRDPDIGAGVVAHPSVPVIGLFPDTIDAPRGTIASVFVDDFALSRHFMLEAMSAPPEYAAVMSAVSPRRAFEITRSYRLLAGFGAMLIDESSPRNRILLDAQGRPQIDYELTHVDRKRLAFAVEEAVRVMLRAGAREVFLPSFEDVYGRDAAGVPRSSFTEAAQVTGLTARLKFVPNRTLVTSAHLQASDKMGTRPEGSVVSTRHQVWGVDGLFVADASTFPSSVGANPMESVYVFAKLFADELLSRAGGVSSGSSPGGRP